MPDREKVSNGLCETIGIIHAYIPKQYWGYGEQACRDALALLKEQETELCDRCGRRRLKSNRVEG